MVMREIMRVPMGMFDVYRSLCFKQARLMNFWMMNLALMSFLFLGKGVEKMSVAGGPLAVYESARSAKRFYVPYFLTSYRWRFPVNK